ncbi:MAG: rubrerythrin family protein [Candidatus Micrarchaeia archaeon]
MNLEEALAKAFVGESMARNRYTLYAKVAIKEGYEQIGGIFLETAEQERQHGKWFFTMMNEVRKKKGLKEISIETEVPHVFGSTIENLNEAITGEHYENSKLYPEIAEIAKTEGYPEIYTRVLMIAKAEMHHEERYSKLLNELKNKSVFKKDEKVVWVCRECGYFHDGTEPPEKCPSCNHPKAFFQVKCENY